jgi:tyrosyl-tRNA synthetase
MNVNRKKAALKAYSPLLSEKSIEEVTELIKADVKGYKESEVAEIVAALQAGPDEQEAEETDTNTYYEEWYCQVSNKKAEKLKVVREKVNITEEEAIILNTGILTGGNTHANMYFAADAELPVGEE